MNNINRRTAVSAVAALLGTAGTAVGTAFAQDFPSRPFKILVPYGPGTGVDVAARMLGERLSRSMGQPFVIENKVGATGTIAGATLAAAAPDGYTLMMDTPSITTTPSMLAMPYHPQTAFAPVAMVAESAFIFVTSPTRGYRNLKDLIAAAKAKPGTVNFASGPPGTSTHLSGEKFRAAAGIQLTHVPYKSTTEALADTMAGRIDFLVTAMPTPVALIKDGKLMGLAVGARRSPLLPDVPTLAEAGVPNAESSIWFGLFAPAKTPKAVVQRLNQEIAKSMTAPDAKERVATMGAEPYTMSVEEFEAVLRREYTDNDKLIKAAGIKM